MSSKVTNVLDGLYAPETSGQIQVNDEVIVDFNQEARLCGQVLALSQ